MTSELVRGGNVPLTQDDGGTPSSARLVFSWRSTGGAPPMSLLAVACDEQGRAVSPAHQVTYTGPSSSGDQSRFAFDVDLAAVPPPVPNLAFALLTDDGSAAQLQDLAATLGVAGREVARYSLRDVPASSALVVLEVYRRGAQWKVRAIGQSLSNGRTGLLRAFALAG
jgi:stress response protein SCP2